MTDDTEAYRRNLIATGQPERDLQHARKRWDTDSLRAEFEVLSFAAPFVVVRRRSDGKAGTLEFTNNPRVYFNWVEDTP